MKIRRASRHHFDRALFPPAEAFYTRELGKLSRPYRGWVRGRCPWHKSKSGLSFAVNLDSGGFYCFGCGAKGGDLIDYVRLRDTVDFKSAAKKLGAWIDDTTPEQQQELRRCEEERRRHQEEESERKEKDRIERISARDHLHATETLYKEAIAAHDWFLMSELLPALRDAEERYCRMADLEVGYGY